MKWGISVQPWSTVGWIMHTFGACRRKLDIDNRQVEAKTITCFCLVWAFTLETSNETKSRSVVDIHVIISLTSKGVQIFSKQCWREVKCIVLVGTETTCGKVLMGPCLLKEHCLTLNDHVLKSNWQVNKMIRIFANKQALWTLGIQLLGFSKPCCFSLKAKLSPSLPPTNKVARR